jgi:hypothetical protein
MGWLRQSAEQMNQVRRGNFDVGANEHVGPLEDEPPLAPMSDEDYDELEQRTNEANAAAQRAGQMKRSYHKSISDQNKPPAEPKEPRQRVVRQPDPVAKTMRNVRKLRALSSKATGRYPSGKRV